MKKYGVPGPKTSRNHENQDFDVRYNEIESLLDQSEAAKIIKLINLFFNKNII